MRGAGPGDAPRTVFDDLAKPVPDRPRSVATDRPVHLARVEARTSINTLASAIQSVILPTNWDSVGGPMSISQLGNALIISADANTHSQIEKVLDLFRQRWATLKTVSLRAWWLPLTEDRLNELLTNETNETVGEKAAFGVIDEAAFKKLLTQQGQADAPIGYRATVTCYNGQTVSTVAGDQSVAVLTTTTLSARAANPPVSPAAQTAPAIARFAAGESWPATAGVPHARQTAAHARPRCWRRFAPARFR
jgi:hypothetical protein